MSDNSQRNCGMYLGSFHCTAYQWNLTLLSHEDSNYDIVYNDQMKRLFSYRFSCILNTRYAIVLGNRQIQVDGHIRKLVYPPLLLSM